MDAAEDRVLTIADACRFLGISRHAFTRDRVWPTLVTRPSRGRVGILLSVLTAEIARRQGSAGEDRPRGRRPQDADEMRAKYGEGSGPRGYRRHRRKAA